MSFQVQPAPRMAKAPMKNSASMPESGTRRRAAIGGSAADHQHGSSSSQEPIGRSSAGKTQIGA